MIEALFEINRFFLKDGGLWIGCGVQVSSLGSGSAGNCTLLASNDALCIIDCGFSYPQLKKRLKALERSVEDIHAIFITHEHYDHVKGLERVAKELGVPVYLTWGTYTSLKFSLPEVQCKMIEPDDWFKVRDLSVYPVAVPHDAREPVQYIFESESLTRFGILTDIGHITPHILTAYDKCDLIFVEANYDEEMLWNGAYPNHLKSRVAGNWGHLSNKQTADFLSKVLKYQHQKVIIGHMSEKNNLLSHVQDTLDTFTHHISYACQEKGCDWVEVAYSQ